MAELPDVAYKYKTPDEVQRIIERACVLLMTLPDGKKRVEEIKKLYTTDYLKALDQDKLNELAGTLLTFIKEYELKNDPLKDALKAFEKQKKRKFF